MYSWISPRTSAISKLSVLMLVLCHSHIPLINLSLSPVPIAWSLNNSCGKNHNHRYSFSLLPVHIAYSPSRLNQSGWLFSRLNDLFSLNRGKKHWNHICTCARQRDVFHLAIFICQVESRRWTETTSIPISARKRNRDIEKEVVAFICHWTEYESVSILTDSQHNKLF